ncbi:MAG: C39 family peptidase [Anaerolineae bacterium]
MKTGIKPLIRVLLLLAISLLLVLSNGLPATALTNLQESPSSSLIIGSGDFPRLPVVAPGPDGTTQALYLVEGNQARQLTQFDGLSIYYSFVTAKASPEGKYVALLLVDAEEVASSVVEIVDLATGERIPVDKEAGELAPAKGAAAQEITSIAWMDEGHLLYTKVTWPSSEELFSAWDRHEPVNVAGEVWSYDLSTKKRTFLTSAGVYRVLEASPNKGSIYVTRLIPGHEEDREEGLALLDLQSGQMENLWPKEDSTNARYLGFTIVTRPDGTQAVMFATAPRSMTVSHEPPVIWLADPQSKTSQVLWTVSEGKELTPDQAEKNTVYDMPSSFIWAPNSPGQFLYQADGSALGGIWWVDLEPAKAQPLVGTEALHSFDIKLLAWSESGIVVQRQGLLRLLDTGGNVLGEIVIAQGGHLAVASIANESVNWPVPFIHQVYDTPDDFAYKYDACGPTSEVMALAYFGRLPKHMIWVNNNVGWHTTDYGYYVSKTYSQPCACDGTTYTFSGGAWQETTTGGVTYAYRMYQYALKHDVGYFYKGSNFSAENVRRELNYGAIILMDTRLTSGHIIAIRGWAGDYFIANDPYGVGADGSYDGMEALYTWSQLNPIWYIVLYGPEMLPNVRNINSVYGSTITIAAMGHWTGFYTDVELCLMNASGSLNQKRPTQRLQPNTSSDISLYSIFGAAVWEGSAVLRISTSAATSVAVTRLATDPYASEGIDSIYPGSISGGGIGSVLYLPSVLYNYYGWSTHLYVENAAGTSTSAVYLYYYRSDGSQINTLPYYGLQPFQRWYVAPWQFDPYTPVNLIGSVKIRSNDGQLLAATVMHDRGGGYTPMSMEYPASNAGGDYGFLPSLLKAYWSWTSAYVLRAANGNASGITYFYPGGASRAFDLVNADDSEEVYLGAPGIPLPDGFHGSGVVAKTGGTGQVVVVGQHSNDTTAMGLRAPKGGHRELNMPLIDTIGSTVGALTIQNLNGNPNGAAITVRVDYYRTDGSLALTYNSPAIAAGRSIELLVGSGVPDEFRGSIWIQCNETSGRIGATVQQSINNDQGYGYSAP